MKKKNIVIKEEKQNKGIIITFKVFQAVFFGVSALGVSMLFGDYIKSIQSPFSIISVTMTVFGIIGVIITGVLSKSAEKW